MVQIHITHNIENVEKRIKGFSRKIGLQLGIAIRKSAFMVERFSKQFTPYKTGTLRRSITSDVLPTRATIAPHTNYAVFVHEGTRFMTGRPFMRKGRIAAEPEIRRIFKSAIARALR